MKRTTYDTVENHVRPAGPRFIIETVKVVREHKEHFVGQVGAPIGELVDDAIRAALESGQELLDVNLHFEREDWARMRDQFLGIPTTEY